MSRQYPTLIAWEFTSVTSDMTVQEKVTNNYFKNPFSKLR